MSEEEKNLVNKIERWINKEEEYCTNEDLKELLNILDKYVDLYKAEKEKNKKIEDKIKMETNRLKEHGYWEFLEQRDLDKTISIIQNLLEE